MLKRIRTYVDKSISSGHWFGFSVRLATFVAAISGAFGAYFFGAYRKISPYVIHIISWLPSDPGIIALALTTLAGLLMSARGLVIYYREKHKVFTLRNTLKNYQENTEQFMLLSQANADCDKELFTIFLDHLAQNPGSNDTMRLRTNHVQKSLSEVESNIERTIEYSATIFSRFTDARCAVCVKTVDYDEANARNLQVDTYRRDDYSHTKRKSYANIPTFVRSNTSDSFVFTEVDGRYLNKIYAEDDLIEAQKMHRYNNERPGWSKDYTATLVCGIENLRRDRKITWSGLLCIDNLHGGLNNETAKNYATEISSRLAVMLYRKELLGEWLVLGEAPKEKG